MFSGHGNRDKPLHMLYVFWQADGANATCSTPNECGTFKILLKEEKAYTTLLVS